MKEDKEFLDPAVEEKLSELEILRQSLEEKDKLARNYYDQLLRLKAEFENYRKRIENEKKQYIILGKQELIDKILPIIENLEKAITLVPAETSWLEGLKMIYNQLWDVLTQEGLKRIETKQKKFDPYYHHAVGEKIDSQLEENVIVEEIKPGYIFNDKVLKPAIVLISKKGGD